MSANIIFIDDPKHIRKTFWKYAIPSLISMLASGLYQIIDGIFIGYYIGAHGLVAINIAWPIIGIIMGLGLMIGMGSGSLISTYLGKKEKKKAENILLSSFILILIFGVISYFFMQQFAIPLMRMQVNSEPALQLAIDYMKVETLFSVFIIASMAMPFLVRNDLSPNFATGLVILGAMINLALDPLFIGYFDWGMKGAAYATSIAQACVSIIALYYFFSGKGYLKVKIKNFKYQWSILQRSLCLGASSFTMYLYFSFVMAIHNLLFSQYGTEHSVAAYAIVGYLMIFYYLFAEGISEGMQPQVSYYTGAKSTENVNKVLFLSLKIVLSVGVLWIIVLNLFPAPFIKLFENNNVILLNEAITGIHLHLFSSFLDGFLVISTVYFLSVGEAKKSLFVSLANMLIQLPFLYFLPKIYGLHGVWLALPISNVLLTLLIAPILYYDIKNRRAKNSPKKPCDDPKEINNNTFTSEKKYKP
ncbi:multidrug efflux pump VmrA [Psychromonas sp. CNPT3]|uniref:MATE family efflux transporter n=1 Tax=Psychromonas sp. CNPT3 TaxID=314282 RepID=UPI0002C0E9F5|nr:MATE family efflux transporter [Psychromonas sp. CNPT3]AGH80684.1 multidrug efflux pump VmrA [Psychromonas sp. CNPT3]